ncbi:MAG: DUF1326 domain-containing protein [Gammaproteobacteria bacterium]|jgi:hypothetical protein|nr:DUF1326 domain-containing protein [Gammaproteobacteria bacterium]MBT5406724.1 DUF1326 domain-containing protein [Gammaproteobacteria bacterium]MBT7236843.1 DUF1326 domain-containing protein [Gammaproteobacteria bacterium]MBV04011.1 hypothetical protein [Paracoccaceae bacterium]|tara:strand:+ start:2039 stop:2638 length:600 start_codon:yes stop_codon:yes gene_type:complete
MSWNLKGDYAESCNCDLMCPCIFLQAPTKGFCEAMLVWDIKEGNLGDVKLDGLKVSAWLHAPSVLTEGGFQLALYVDENASDAQHDAIVELWSGKHGGHLGVIASLVGEIIGVKKAAITCSIDGGKKTLQVSGAGGWDMAGVESGDGKIAQCNFHPLAINPGFPVDVNVTSKQEYSDHGRSWNTTPDRVGLSGPFTYQA